MIVKRVSEYKSTKESNTIMTYKITLIRHEKNKRCVLETVHVYTRSHAIDAAYETFYEMAGYNAARDTQRAWDVKKLVEAWELDGTNDLSVILDNYSLTFECI